MTTILLHPEITLDSSWRSAENQEVIETACCFLVGGAVQSLVGFPFDLVKFVRQSSSISSHNILGHQPASSSTLSILRQLHATVGMRGLWTGAAVPSLIGAPLSIITGFYAYQRAIISMGSNGATPDLSASLLGGAWAGLWMSLPETLFDLTKIQTQSKIYTFRSSVSALMTLPYRPNDHRGPLQGLSATILRNVPANALYFLTYDWLSLTLRTADADLPNSNGEIMLAGAGASTAYWMAAYPLDTLKTRMQADDNFKERAKYPTLRSVIAQRKSPFLGSLWAGVLPTILKAAPANALGFLAFESLRNYL